ncbi:MAG: GyrI-like domain-containing protein [Actinomycetota bacterium]|nr:GyrI-like domain-containing protein [Actinomycetota bacterium]
MTDQVDFKKSLDAYHAKRGEFRVVEVPDMHYLMVDGHGDPNTSPAYAEALRALYPVAYKLKFASRRDLGRDYVVPPLEGLWWAQDMDSFTAARDKSRWDWTLMIMVPDWIDQRMFGAAIEQVAAKDRTARLDDIRLETLSEGRCVQTLHVGSFDDEADVLARMHHGFIPDNGLRMAGKHHEIYLSDSRKVTPEKLQTILRQPVSITTVPTKRLSRSPMRAEQSPPRPTHGHQ